MNHPYQFLHEKTFLGQVIGTFPVLGKNGLFGSVAIIHLGSVRLTGLT